MAPRVIVQPINVIFKHLQSGTKVSIWLYDNVEQRLEGKIIVRYDPAYMRRTIMADLVARVMFALWQGFDEFMNVVLDEAEEVWIKETKTKKVGSRNTLGRLLLKGENITLIQAAEPGQGGKMGR